MKILLLLLLFPAMALSAPFVVSDLTTQQVSHCGWVLDTASKIDLSVAKDASGASFCRYDLALVSTGKHSLKATFVFIDPVWGRLESDFSAPFEFTKPAGDIASPPAGLKIMP